jgi:hypothetical protein
MARRPPGGVRRSTSWWYSGAVAAMSLEQAPETTKTPTDHEDQWDLVNS